jgi:hypothetical protein
MTAAQGRNAMNREHQHEHDDLIDLGAASVETKGSPFGTDDHKAGLIPVYGLSDE